MEFLEFIEQTTIATFVRESESLLGFPTFLFFHTIGLSLLVGVNGIVAIRILGVASTIPLRPLGRLFPFMWLGFILTVLSGVGLAMAHATSKFVNPILLIKLVFVVIATVIMRMLEKKFFRSPSGVKEAEAGGGTTMAAALIVLWTLVMITGRLIAYSSTILGT